MHSTSGPKRGLGRVAFLAHADKFRELLVAGHPLQAIYDDYQKELGIGYPQFTRYVRKYLKADDGHQTKATGPALPATPDPHPGSTAGSKPAGKPSPFKHDPGGGNDRDDLI